MSGSIYSGILNLSIGGAIVGFWAGIIFGIGGCDKGIEFVISRLFNCIIIGFASGLVYGIII
ncbi:MAG: hypothetical protein IPJ51_19655 [Saprospiraceae bacterium]|nr:hypothetical protein [Saprospiraceae bacterium]